MSIEAKSLISASAAPDSGKTTPNVTLPAAKAAGVKTEPISAAAASARTRRDGIGAHVTVCALSVARNRPLPRAIVELVAAHPAIAVSSACAPQAESVNR